jgi:hypothetical protein
MMNPSASTSFSINLDSVAMATYLPLGELEVHLSTALGRNSLVLLERSTNDTGRDGEESVVAGAR